VSYLLDTPVLWEVKRPEPDAKVLAWLGEQPLTDMCLSVVTLGELQEGIAALKDAGEARALQGWLETLQQSFSGRILDVTPDVAATWGRLRAEARRQGQMPPVIEVLLIATAITHNLTLVTRNVVEGELGSVEVLNPWR
jgi:predicted nucleic acid-binding protein